MKNLKIYSLFAILVLIISACDDDEHKGNSPDFNDYVGAVTLVSVNPDKNFYNFLADDFSSEEVEFEVNVDGFELTEITSVDVQLVFTEVDAINDSLRGGIIDSTYAPIVLQTIQTFPSMVSFTVADMATFLRKEVSDFKVGDQFSLTLPINTADGRRLTVALNSDLCQEPAQPSAGGCEVAWAVSCPSSIPSGTWSTNAGYDVEIVDDGGGSYSIANFNLDYQPSFYLTFTSLPIGGGFTDVCNVINLGQAAQFGVRWTATGIYDPDAQTIFFPEISDPAYGQGPWDNGGAGYLLTKN